MQARLYSVISHRPKPNAAAWRNDSLADVVLHHTPICHDVSCTCQHIGAACAAYLGDADLTDSFADVPTPVVSVEADHVGVELTICGEAAKRNVTDDTTVRRNLVLDTRSDTSTRSDNERRVTSPHNAGCRNLQGNGQEVTIGCGKERKRVVSIAPPVMAMTKTMKRKIPSSGCGDPNVVACHRRKMVKVELCNDESRKISTATTGLPPLTGNTHSSRVDCTITDHKVDTVDRRYYFPQSIIASCNAAASKSSRQFLHDGYASSVLPRKPPIYATLAGLKVASFHASHGRYTTNKLQVHPNPLPPTGKAANPDQKQFATSQSSESELRYPPIAVKSTKCKYRKVLLWKFVIDELFRPGNQLIEWVPNEKGENELVFKILEGEKLAAEWCRKNPQQANHVAPKYSHMARALRLYKVPRTHTTKAILVDAKFPHKTFQFRDIPIVRDYLRQAQHRDTQHT